MKIAIQAADLDSVRIDGTRIYLFNLLKYFGKLSSQDTFFIYHKKKFNPQLRPPSLTNYKIKQIPMPFFWTQTRLAWEIWKDKIDIIWMPMHNIPLLKSKKTKAVVTIHDLAFKKFPQTFPKKYNFKLNFLTNLAIKKSDKIIAVSYSTKKDILKFYPQINSQKIRVIYHGFDDSLLNRYLNDKATKKILTKFKLQNIKYILYVGAIQPRKNLITLIRAFEIYKIKTNSKIKLVLAGGKAWKWEETVKAIKVSKFKPDIVLTGKVNFQERSVLYQKANLFVFPSLYEGFGIPILEAMASDLPVISADNSSLLEVGGKAVEYFKAENEKELAQKIEKVLNDKKLREEMIQRGQKQIQKFSWKKCAKETLEWLLL